jgi:hypothetical protein
MSLVAFVFLAHVDQDRVVLRVEKLGRLRHSGLTYVRASL